MDRTKIEWCDSTWNPITGCYHGCEYCYARKIVERFAGCDAQSTFGPYNHSWHRADTNTELFRGQGTAEKPMLFVLDKPLYNTCRLDKLKTEKLGRQVFTNPKAPYPFGFAPTFYRYRLDEPSLKKKPKNIFVCSTADLFGEWVPDDWIEEVFDSCAKAPWHRYLFLTKNPSRYIELAENGKLPTDDNLWYGSTVTTQETEFFFSEAHNTFVSVEPISGPFDSKTENGFHGTDWVIIGAETGNRKNKIIPKREWIENIHTACERGGIPLFMKDSLIPIVSEENMKREFPWNGVK